MSDGLIAMAEHGQPVVATPFTLAGAMSPVSIAGAIAQQNAEALFLVALAQIVRPGAPMVYGAFTSNVDMRTGSPAFGTPESVKAQFASGQMARRYGLPWRSSNATASPVVDAQAAYEAEMAVWGAVMGGVNLLYQGAGWLEGGLTASYEKLIIDAEILQMMAEVLQPLEVSEGALGLEAIAEVGPGGHFFGTAHTLERYETVPNSHGTGERHLEASARRGGAAVSGSGRRRGTRGLRGPAKTGDRSRRVTARHAWTASRRLGWS
jgi:trimethylamine--corrinoid protein Co-methyltransferase